MLNKKDNPQGFPYFIEVIGGKTREEKYAIYEDNYYTLNQYKSNYSLDEVKELKEIEEEIGIPTLIYMKAMTKGVWIKTKELEWGKVGEDRDIAPYKVESLDSEVLVVKAPYGGEKHTIENPMESYGDLWALTYDELWNPTNSERKNLEKELNDCIDLLDEIQKDRDEVSKRVLLYYQWSKFAPKPPIGFGEKESLAMSLDDMIEKENKYLEALDKSYKSVFENYHKILKKLGRE